MRKKSRFRIFAGPNGSGKSTLFEYLKSSKFIYTEIYISADRIEETLRKKRQFNFNAYHVKNSKEDFNRYIEQHGLIQILNQNKIPLHYTLKKGLLKAKKNSINSYLASFIAGYLVEKLLETGQSFCFETVMSHESKLELIEKAQNNGYRTYLYFIFTQYIELNIARIQQRVKAGGHDVPEDKIRERYSKSIAVGMTAFEKTDSGYMIDTTQSDFNIVAEKRNKQIIWADQEAQEFLTSLR